METIHKLDFEACPWEPAFKDLLPQLIADVMRIKEPIVAFRVGTCEGIYTVRDNAFQIIAVQNSKPGNGHFEDVIQWFENSCKRDKKNLMFMEIMNPKFGKHLCDKRGFKRKGSHAIKLLTQS